MKINFYKLIVEAIIILNVLSLSSQTKTSTGNGNWNSPGTWSPSGVPTATDNVLITGNHRVDITSNGTCNSLTIGLGGNAQLRFSSGTDRVFTVQNDVLIGINARFRVRQNNATHTLSLGGNLVNNGSVEFYSTANRNVELILTKNGNQFISGNGTLSRFHLIKLNMGATLNNIAEFSTSSFVVDNDFLRITNGTFKFSTPTAVNIVPFANATTLTSTSGLWMNAALSTMTVPANLTVSGKLTVSNGTMIVGNANNENLLYSSGTLSVTGGTLNVAGRFCGSNIFSTCNFNMSGGTINVPTFQSNNSLFNEAPFQIGTAGSVFNMSGGTILINKEGSALLSSDLGYVNLAGSGAVTDGTLQIGSALSPVGQTMRINSTASIGNLLINNATATASIITNPLNIVKNVIINSGILNANNLNITLGGNWQNNGGTFTPGNAIVHFNSNLAQSIFKSTGETFNNVLFSGSGIKTFSSSVTSSGNFSINTGATVDVSNSNYPLTIKRNFFNNGNFNAQNGTVLMTGTVTQNISGSSTTNFYNLLLNNTSGAILLSPANLINSLLLSNGTLNTNGQVFTMLSTASNTARIETIFGTGDIIGNVTVQRYAPGGATGWALFGTPIASGLTLNDWDDDIFISCPTCPDGSAAGFLSIYTYDESAAGSYSNPISYVPLNTINDVINPNKGYWVYLGNGQYTTSGITIDVTGPVRKFNQIIPLSYTNNAPVADIGWNLILNPYPSPISWAALKGSTPNIDDAIYVYNADLNSGTGSFASYVNGNSSPVVGSGGIGDIIPMSQAFYVHSTGATSLVANEFCKSTIDQVYLKNNTSSTQQKIRVKMAGPYMFNDEFLLYTQTGASVNFDSKFDAIKMAGQNPYAPTISNLESDNIFQINGIPEISGTYTTNVKTLTGYAGIYTISATEYTSFPAGTCVNLYDKFTSTSFDLTSGNYVFNLSDTTTVSRFVLSITINSLQASTLLTQPTCQSANNGSITAIGQNAGPWNYYWKDGSNAIIKTSLNKNSADTLLNLSDGIYNLDITTVGQCDNHQSSYQIIKKLPVVASFYMVDTCYLNQEPKIPFLNFSTNVSTSIWDFGDNSPLSSVFAPTHTYTSPGSFVVKYIGTSSTGCTDSLSKIIIVKNKPVGLDENQLSVNGISIKNLGANYYIIEGTLTGEQTVNYKVMDVNGKIILDKKENVTNKLSLNLNLNEYANGIYLLDLMVGSKKSVIKLPVTN